MLPKLWIFDTYSIMLLIGVIACFYAFYFYHKRIGSNASYTLDLLLVGIISIIMGLLSATGFQYLFDFLKPDTTNSFGAMTFYGGLLGGVIVFIFGYLIYIRRKYPNSNFIRDVMIIAPAGIAIAHAFGRIGCFLAGCCYGIETDSPLGVRFPGMEHNVYPTQLFEAIFLFLLFAVLFYLAIKRKSKYTLSIYLIGYGVWRFLIEFIRGDDRGAYMLGLSPSQWFSIAAVIIGIGVILYFNIMKARKALK